VDEKLYTVTPTPHILDSGSIEKTMLYVIIALTPATVMGIVFFGLRALLMILISIGSALFFEAAYQKFTKQPVTVFDGSAVITGLLLALILPPAIPLWMPVFGNFAAIILVKQIFGGLGHNFLNPALAGRAVLVAAFAYPMTTQFILPFSGFINIDTIASPTPLFLMETGEFTPALNDYLNAFWGNISGSIGETSVIAILIGGLFLLFTKTISWHIPVSFIAAVGILTAIFHADGFTGGIALYHLITGGLFLGAFFMATDYPTSPVTPMGKLIFGVGCGVITVVIRLFGGFPEGVAYAILLMNLTVPLIDRFIRPRVLGTRSKRAKI